MPGGPQKKRRMVASDFEQSSSSGGGINYRAPCTSAEGRPCDIFKNLRFWNVFFWPVGHKLREVHPGQLSLVETSRADMSTLDWLNHQGKAATLLQHLLRYHRCLVTVQLGHWLLMAHHQPICDALVKSPSLRKLRLRLWNVDPRVLRSFAVVLPHLKNLEELECLNYLEKTFCEGLSEFLVNARSLTTFTLKRPVLDSLGGRIISQGLMRNASITALSLHLKSNSYGKKLAEYLRENQTLRNLTLIADEYATFDQRELRLIIRSLFRTTTLSEVKLENFKKNEDNSCLVALLFSKNQSLRDFHMVKGSLYTDAYPPKSALFYPWLAAFRKNKTLEKLTMELSCFSLEQCRSLFEALKFNASLKNITVERIQPLSAAEISRAMRDTGVRECFFFSSPCYVENPCVELMGCKDLSNVAIHASVFTNSDSFRTTLHVLPSCTHVTSLSITVWEELFDWNAMNALISQYIAATTVLKELSLTIFREIRDHVNHNESVLVRALAINKSIRRLHIDRLCFNESEAQALADILQSTRTMCYFSYYPEDWQYTTLLFQKLSTNFSSNYTILGLNGYIHQVDHHDLFILDDVVHRNVSLVARAAHFVTGTRHRYLAAAVELVHFNPGLVESVRKLASIDEDEALSRIKNSLKSFSELDDFMRLAGVVKHGVSCHRRDDGQKQLVDIGRDCWLWIRQYLTVGDILDEH
ncbi:hypothetical protein HPB51_010547 [Rhipicephalus microplus]|uniref:Uncharacterized protein n=1 Tax=Rhipicephalus microplus TaxID=6941 RepID=A0A9J6E953_RHIMP|nr:hypothetical protein HPB51_010547 [Rhipicephalus microplus]